MVCRAREFAAKAGLDRAYYGAVERGKRNLSARNLIKIAVALNVDVGALFPPTSDLRWSVGSVADGEKERMEVAADGGIPRL